MLSCAFLSFTITKTSHDYTKIECLAWQAQTRAIVVCNRYCLFYSKDWLLCGLAAAATWAAPCISHAFRKSIRWIKPAGIKERPCTGIAFGEHARFCIVFCARMIMLLPPYYFDILSFKPEVPVLLAFCFPFLQFPFCSASSSASDCNFSFVLLCFLTLL